MLAVRAMHALVCMRFCPACASCAVALQAKKIDRRMKACQGILVKSASCLEKQSSAQQQHLQVSCHSAIIAQ